MTVFFHLDISKAVCICVNVCVHGFSFVMGSDTTQKRKGRDEYRLEPAGWDRNSLERWEYLDRWIHGQRWRDVQGLEEKREETKKDMKIFHLLKLY